jgi:hypothetical protein
MLSEQVAPQITGTGNSNEYAFIKFQGYHKCDWNMLLKALK